MTAVWSRRFGTLLVVVGLLLPWGIWAQRLLGARSSPVLSLRPELVILPAGSFSMGSPADEAGRDPDEVQHSVALSRPFALSRTEITQAQFRAVMGKDVALDGCASPPPLGDDLPVTCVSWSDAAEYCNRLSTLEGRTPAYAISNDDVSWIPNTNGYRLPTEAEWEYAARAGRPTSHAGASTPAEVAWTDTNAGGAAHPVAQLQPNAWGFYDLSGNAAEWVWDSSGAYAEGPATDPMGPASNDRRVVRGGSWADDIDHARVAHRDAEDPRTGKASLGFRVARSE